MLAGLGAPAFAQFETRTSFPGLSNANALAVGDFNRDGKLDFADADTNLQVFLGNGDGTFEPPANYLVGTGVIFVAAADLNHDGKLDLIVANLDGLFVLLGNGDGTFQTPAVYTTACIPIFVSTGDFNGDHKLDLLVTYSSSACGYVSIFLGNGDGTFQHSPINTSASYSPAAIGFGDFNGDGKLDIVVAAQFGTISQVEIMLGNGDGTFSGGATYPVNSSPVSIAVTDFRGNGKKDFAVASLYGGTDEFLGQGDGTFTLASKSLTNGALWVTAADLNGDGKPDLAVAQLGRPGVPGVAVILNNGDGTFQSPVFYPVSQNNAFVVAGDFNGDHKMDLLVPYYGGDVFELLNTGMVSFSPTTPVNYPFQLVGTTSVLQTVTLANTGTTALSIFSFHVAGPFRQSNTCGTSVAPGANCKIEVRFKPSATGNATGTITISDSASSKPQIIELTGVGTLVGISPLKLTFPPQAVGTVSAPQNITLTNDSATILNVTGIGITGEYQNFSQSNNCQSLKANASCTIAVKFTPTQQGKRTATLVIYDDGQGSPQAIPLNGTGD